MRVFGDAWDPQAISILNGFYMQEFDFIIISFQHQ